MKIESEDIDIENLLNGRFFSIPRFQRPYSWNEENIQDLWHDVIASDGGDYFIGSMVVYSESKQEYGVVDGQQRLTTISIFLCVLRDALEKLGELDRAAGLHQLIERRNRDNKKVYVLQNRTASPFLEDAILRQGDSELGKSDIKPEEITLKQAFTALSQKVDETLQAIDIDPTILDSDRTNKKVQKLSSVVDSVLNLKIILVKLETEDDAYLIFETLNTRGKDLSVTDLLKTHFTKVLPAKSSVDATSEKWKEILGTIHDSSVELNTDTFIYHHWASRYDSTPLKKLYPVIKKRIIKRNAKSHLEDLISDSRYYRAIHEPDYMWDKSELEISRALRAIQLFKLSQPTPAILSLVRSYKAGVIKQKQLKRALFAIENFHFVFTAVTSSRSSGGISGMYSAFARKMSEASDAHHSSQIIDELVDKLRVRRPSIEEFSVDFTTIGFTNTNTKQKNLVRYILRKFADHEKHKFIGDDIELNIEHLAPQNKIGTHEWTSANVGELGNLFLIDPSINHLLNTKSFDEKIEILKHEKASYPEYLNKCSVWNPNAIRNRTIEMAATAYNDIWAI